MGLGGILILLLLLVSLIVFVYVLVLTARSWGVLHSILLSILFIECWVFLFFSANVQSTRVRYTREAWQNKKQAEEAMAKTAVLRYGTTVDPDSLDAVVPVKGKLRRLTADRGRAWRQLTLVQSNNGEYELAFTGAAPAADPLGDDGGAAAAPPTVISDSLPANLIVYAFAERQDAEGRPMPVFYLGEFTVTKSAGGQVTLKPTLPLHPTQLAKIKSGEAASWTLYELLPIDSHLAFRAPGSKPSNEEAFGRMDEEALKALFADMPEGEAKTRVLNDYLRDGKRASDDDEPATIWVQVNVLKPVTIDVDSDEVRNAENGGYFDTIGRAVDSRLKRPASDKGTVRLTPEMNSKPIILKEEAAREFIDRGDMELVQRIYVRPLNDYEEAFNENFIFADELAERISLFEKESKAIEEANQLGVEMLAFRQVENQKLASDLANYAKEVAVLNEVVAASSKALADLKSELSQRYRKIQSTHDRLISTK